MMLKPPTRMCPKCAYIHETAMVCPACGHHYEPSPRQIVALAHLRNRHDCYPELANIASRFLGPGTAAHLRKLIPLGLVEATKGGKGSRRPDPGQKTVVEAYTMNSIEDKVRRRLYDLTTVPIIFANGRDCDLTGIYYAAMNKRVNFDGRIYEPGEAIHVHGRKLMVQCGKIILEGSGGVQVFEPQKASPAGAVVIQVPHDTRELGFWKSTMQFGIKVEA